MYSAVYWGGPRWSQTVIDNVQLALDQYLESSTPESRTLHYPMPADEFGISRIRGPYTKLREITPGLTTYRYPFVENDLITLKNELTQKNMSLDAIDRLVDQHVQSLQGTHK